MAALERRGQPRCGALGRCGLRPPLSPHSAPSQPRISARGPRRPRPGLLREMSPAEGPLRPVRCPLLCWCRAGTRRGTAPRSAERGQRGGAASPPVPSSRGPCRAPAPHSLPRRDPPPGGLWRDGAGCGVPVLLSPSLGTLGLPCRGGCGGGGGQTRRRGTEASSLPCCWFTQLC